MSSIQQLQSIMHHGGGDHVDSCDRCTSMKLVMVSGIGLTSDLDGGGQHGRAVMGRAAVTADACRRAPKAFLRFCGQGEATTLHVVGAPNTTVRAAGLTASAGVEPLGLLE